ncbi:MAG: hypothetical protein FD157_4125 [Rhodocyclaceae bacterium]|nr:MAG: hypothetical protein FD157_4125 [Rhodocyclaceae bacterium]TNC97265.1 MAG: hypothetical protein FD118_4137 [Rhodocyclaceae bacterium]
MSPQLRHKTVRLGAALVLAACAASAAAETVQLRYVSPAAALATPLHLPPGTQSYYVGSYNLQIQTPATSFQAYCVDPFQYASTGYLSYGKSPLASFLSGSAQKLADVSSLFAHAYANTIGNATKAAGFQLALWEVFNDNKNLTSGSVYKTSQTNAAAVAEANNLLASLAASTWTTPAANYDLTMFSNAQKQDFLAAAPAVTPSTTSPVPEPEASMLLLAGLGLLGLALRSRRNRPPSV